jgi:hypothetical protein
MFQEYLHLYIYLYLVTKGDCHVKEQELLDYLWAFSKTAVSKQPDETVGIGKL